MNTILFENTNYRIRQIEIDDKGFLNIASTQLNNKLFCENGAYIFSEAAFIDEQIYFFVDTAKLRLKDEQLIENVICNC